MKVRFTRAEKIVLHGLVKYPTLNDRELSETINVKPSTTTAIRRRLREREVFATKRIPMAHRLGYELLITFYGRIDPKVKEAEKSLLERLLKNTPQIFFSFRSSDSVFAIGYFRSFTDYRRFADGLWERFGDSDIIDPERCSSAIFSLGTSKLLNFFDYTPPLRTVFEIKEKAKVDRSMERVSEDRLTRKEKTVLQGLVNYPESSDKSIAEKIRASRQAISAMRRRFEERGILRTIRIVNLGKVGYTMLVLAHTLFRPRAPLKARWREIRKITELIPQFLNVTTNPENVLLASAVSYDHFHKVKNEVIELYSGKGYLQSEPTMLLFPLSDLRIMKNFDFSGLVRRVVQEED